MGSLLASILPLAIGAAISPTILAGQLLILSGKEFAIKRALMFLLGSGLVLIGYTAVAVLAGVGSDAASKPSTVDGVIKLFFAVVLLVLGIRALLRGPKPEKAKKPAAGPRFVRSFEFGAVLMLLNFTTLALYFPAVHETVASSVSSSDELLAIVILYLITMIPAWMPLVATVVVGAPAKRALARLNAFMTRHSQAITVAICFLFAAYLGVSGAKILF